MRFNIYQIKNFFSRLSLNKKLVALMLVQSLSIISILVFLYYQTETSIYKEFEKQIADLSKGIQMGVEEVTSSGLPEEKRLQNYLKKLKQRALKRSPSSAIPTGSYRALTREMSENGSQRQKKSSSSRQNLGSP